MSRLAIIEKEAHLLKGVDKFHAKGFVDSEKLPLYINKLGENVDKVLLPIDFNLEIGSYATCVRESQFDMNVIREDAKHDNKGYGAGFKNGMVIKISRFSTGCLIAWPSSGGNGIYTNYLRPATESEIEMFQFKQANKKM